MNVPIAPPDDDAAPTAHGARDRLGALATLLAECEIVLALLDPTDPEARALRRQIVSAQAELARLRGTLPIPQRSLDQRKRLLDEFGEMDFSPSAPS